MKFREIGNGDIELLKITKAEFEAFGRLNGWLTEKGEAIYQINGKSQGQAAVKKQGRTRKDISTYKIAE